MGPLAPHESDYVIREERAPASPLTLAEQLELGEPPQRIHGALVADVVISCDGRGRQHWSADQVTGEALRDA